MDVKDNTRRAALVSIVDDDGLMRNSTSRLLRSAGMRVEAFASAEEFLTSGRAEETACLMRERAQHIGGQLDVETPKKGGTSIRVRVPLAKVDKSINPVCTNETVKN